MRFYLGVHEPAWLERTTVPLFVSHRRLARRKRLPRAAGPWALDSGGFTELSMHGAWTSGPRPYALAVQRYVDEVGRLEWAAPQDWMCEPFMLARTGLDVATHQRLTVENLLELRTIAPALPWVPVLQGWRLDDYLRHVEQYADAGVDLRSEALVGLGSVCRRQGMREGRGDRAAPHRPRSTTSRVRFQDEGTRALRRRPCQLRFDGVELPGAAGGAAVRLHAQVLRELPGVRAPVARAGGRARADGSPDGHVLRCS